MTERFTFETLYTKPKRIIAMLYALGLVYMALAVVGLIVGEWPESLVPALIGLIGIGLVRIVEASYLVERHFVELRSNEFVISIYYPVCPWKLYVAYTSIQTVLSETSHDGTLTSWWPLTRWFRRKHVDVHVENVNCRWGGLPLPYPWKTLHLLLKDPEAFAVKLRARMGEGSGIPQPPIA